MTYNSLSQKGLGVFDSDEFWVAPRLSFSVKIFLESLFKLEDFPSHTAGMTCLSGPLQSVGSK